MSEGLSPGLLAKQLLVLSNMPTTSVIKILCTSNLNCFSFITFYRHLFVRFSTAIIVRSLKTRQIQEVLLDRQSYQWYRGCWVYSLPNRGYWWQDDFTAPISGNLIHLDLWNSPRRLFSLMTSEYSSLFDVSLSISPHCFMPYFCDFMSFAFSVHVLGSWRVFFF